MGAIRDSFETSLAAAIELDVVEPDKHAAVIAGARACADLLDADTPKASLLSTYLTYCKTLGIAPAQQSEPQVVGAGRVAKMRAHSRASLRAI
jgi:hypothetical protein